MNRLAAVLLASGAIHACREPEATEPLELMEETYVVFAPAEEKDIAPRISLEGDVRRALAASLPAEFRYRVQVPERALLTFAVAIVTTPSARGDEALPGERLRFAVRAGENVPDELLFERDIHVARRGQWIEQAVDLRAFSGKEVWLSFETSFPSASDDEALPVFGAFAEPVVHDRARYRRGRGVVLVSIDTLRRDHVSVYGYPRRTTPGLSALATESVVFEDAVSTSSWTLPAHGSLLTSTYPSVHGAVSLHVALSPAWPNLAALLQQAGFATRAIVTHVYLSRDYGLAEGFDHHLYLPETRAEEVTNRAVQLLTAMGDRDFFLFVHYYDPHWHYDPPSPYDTMFDASYSGKTTGVWWDFKELDAETIDPRDLRHIVSLYDGEIRYTDHHVERLFREMKRLGVFDKSLIVVTSDHGEEFLEHGSWEHQKTLYEEQLRIPLIVKYPGGEHGGERFGGQVSLIDVAPTVLDTLGLLRPASFQGRSLRSASSARALWAETEHTLDGSHKLSLRRGADAGKAIFTVRGEDVATELFDLSRDPLELEPLRDPEMRDRAEQRLAEYLTEVSAAREGRGDAPAVVLDPEELERLRSLGYIQ